MRICWVPYYSLRSTIHALLVSSKLHNHTTARHINYYEERSLPLEPWPHEPRDEGAPDPHAGRGDDDCDDERSPQDDNPEDHEDAARGA